MADKSPLTLASLALVATLVISAWIREPSVSIQELEGNRIKVSVDGESKSTYYRMGSRRYLTVHPVMKQKWGLGVPKDSGIVSQVYYLTPEQLSRKRQEYDPNQGCFSNTLNNEMQQLLLLPRDSSLSSAIPHRIPDAGKREVTVEIEGYFLEPDYRYAGSSNASAESYDFRDGRQIFYLTSLRRVTESRVSR